MTENAPHPLSSTDNRLPAGLAELPGLDAEAGIAALHGKADKYLELLQRFVAEHASDLERLIGHLVGGEQAHAIRLIHNVKGTAATLGARHLAETARQLEIKLRSTPDGAVDTGTLEADFCAIRQAFERLAAALPPPPAAPQVPAGAAQALEPQRLQEILDGLDALLEDGEIAAGELFREHAAALGASLGAGCEEVGRAIRQFDFKAAQECLRALRRAGEGTASR
jgi:two-component system, sensor histidine kinase and response regulator